MAERICGGCLGVTGMPGGDEFCPESDSDEREHEPMADPTTPEEFRALVDRIRAIASANMDDPAAHRAEDSLGWAALRAIAAGAAEPAQIAEAVLATRSIPVCRWFS